MDSALFYTFSTIPQTLGGAIALIAAFVLYQLQSLNSQAEDIITQRILNLVVDGTLKDTLDGFRIDGKHEEIERYYRENPPNGHLKIPVDRLNSLMNQKRRLIKAFKSALWLTVGLIAVSVSVLASEPAIRCWHIVILVGILAGGSLWFFVCLLSYGRLIRRALFGR